jgi:glycerate kinase
MRLIPSAPGAGPGLSGQAGTDGGPGALNTWLGDADLSAWMEGARLKAARGIGDHLTGPRMKSALARMFANAEPAITGDNSAGPVYQPCRGLLRTVSAARTLPEPRGCDGVA